MESKWTGSIESAFFDADRFAKARTIKIPEDKYNNKINRNSYYVLGVDVGRFNCTTEIVVIKVTPAPSGVPIKNVVNIYSLEEENFIEQARKIKRIFMKFKCKCAVVDANGLGAGLVDLLVVDDIDPETDELLPGLGVINDEERRYRDYETENTLYKSMYVLKANPTLNSLMYSYCQTQLTNGKIRFLIDENQARNKLDSQKQGRSMSALAKEIKLQPYIQTTILREQMMNLTEQSEGQNIVLKQNNRRIKKDKFSALIYGLWFCKLEEDKNKKRKMRDITQFMFFS